MTIAQKFEAYIENEGVGYEQESYVLDYPGRHVDTIVEENLDFFEYMEAYTNHVVLIDHQWFCVFRVYFSDESYTTLIVELDEDDHYDINIRPFHANAHAEVYNIVKRELRNTQLVVDQLENYSHQITGGDDDGDLKV